MQVLAKNRDGKEKKRVIYIRHLVSSLVYSSTPMELIRLQH